MSAGVIDGDDAGLVAEIAAGSRAALHTAYRRYGGRVLSTARGVLRDEALAEDITQEVMLRLWRRPDRFDPSRGSLTTVLIRDAHGRAVDLLRSELSRRTREERDQERSSVDEAGPEHEVWERIRSAEVSAALRSLPERERAAVVLAYYEGLSYREVAERLGEPEGTVKSRIRAGLQRLQGPLRRAGLVET